MRFETDTEKHGEEEAEGERKELEIARQNESREMYSAIRPHKKKTHTQGNKNSQALSGRRQKMSFSGARRQIDRKRRRRQRRGLKRCIES